MVLFKEHNFTDSCLPLEEWSKERLKKNTGSHPFVLMERDQAAKTKRIWSVYSIDRFCKAQWEFQAPIISTAKKNHNFDQRIIPFVAKSTTPSSGAHGIVYRYTIHSAHFEDPLHPVIVKYS
jgi:hypothetical protein